MPSYLTLGGILGGTTLALFLIRKYMSRKWGSFTSDLRLDGKVLFVVFFIRVDKLTHKFQTTNPIYNERGEVPFLQE